jgi:phosphoenolpyruvate carboxylase
MADIDQEVPTVATLAADLLDLTERACEHAAEDPFGNPMLAVALAITRRVDHGHITLDGLEDLIRHLRDAAFADRAARFAKYVGGTDRQTNEAALARLAESLVRPDPDDSPVPLARFRSAVERTRFAAVFTAHPTFANPPDVLATLAEAASGRPAASHLSHRPSPPTLEDEFQQACAAIARGRDALDVLNAALLTAARACWRERGTGLIPRAVILSSWVGYDTDGRNDIHWWDTLRLRLRMKRLQLERLVEKLADLEIRSAASATDALRECLLTAITAVTAQINDCPTGADAQAVARFAHTLIDRRDEALLTPEPLMALFADAIAAAEEGDRLTLCVARAGLASHGLALAHTHVRLNGTQLHNAIRQRLGFDDQPEDPASRRVLLSQMNAALDAVTPVPVDFGGLLVEQASAVRLMMTVAQIAKHIDAATPIRFLIAETESGYTLLAALWLARLFGIEKHIEISPLFETAEALERGVRVVEEAVRSPHWRAYLQGIGRLSLQFGYSDSGRYVGQLAASYLIERLRLKIAEMLERHGVSGVEIVLFDTHGESIGRGAHPGTLADRLTYLSPTTSRQALASAGLAVREESAFQGGDGYLFFGTPELALATVTRLAEHAFPPPAPPSADPVYADPDFAADFFPTIGAGMQALVEDPGYAALLGAFGPALLDKTGSRPSARQSDGMGGPATITHPRELRAIPNNAILQQLGWCANTLHGLGAAVERHPEAFGDLLVSSPRFRRAIDLAEHALRHSDIDVLRAVIATFDPTTWLDRAGHARFPANRRAALVTVARGVERLGLAAPLQAMFRRLQADHLALRGVWTDAPRMARREMLLHALRIALINRIWLLETEIPDFSTRYGISRQALTLRIYRLDVPASLNLLGQIFPLQPDEAADLDYAEPPAPRAAAAYTREHAEIFVPMQRIFNMVREVGTAITHELGAFG